MGDRMFEWTEKGNGLPEGSFKEQWKEIRAAIDDRVLRACLPTDIHSVVADENAVSISVDTEFKKDYCQRKLSELERAVRTVLGVRQVVIGELPLVEQVKEDEGDHRPTARILVVGVGDGGVNAVERMRQEGLHGVRLVAVDTDRQVLDASKIREKLQLGMDITGGRGSGGRPERGRRAALESRWEIVNLIQGMDLVFITAGLGGGTGTGAAPLIAEIARENGALTVGVVTRPFSFEGTVRREHCEEGLQELRTASDVLIVVSNDRLLETSARGLPVTRAFELADGVLHQGVRGISDLITIRGLVNLDFADIRTVLAGAGDAMMAMGVASGEGRAVTAAKMASANPLLEGNTIRGAQRVIMNVTGGESLTLGEVTAAADQLRRMTATECDLVFGAVVRQELADEVHITVIAADFREAGGIQREGRGPAKRERIAVDEQLDVPTFLRRQRSSKEGEANR